MTKYEIIKGRIENLPTNMIGKNRLTILNIAEDMECSVEQVSEVVNDMVADGDLKFERRTVTPNDKTYKLEYIEVVRRRKIMKKDNSHLYR